MPKHTRRIGAIGTGTRISIGLGLEMLALPDGGSWGLAWYQAVLGLVALPAIMLTIGHAARRYAHGPVLPSAPSGRRDLCRR